MALGWFKKKSIKKSLPHQKVFCNTLYEKLIFHPEKFSFVKALDVVSACETEVVEIKANVNFSSKYTDISAVEGLKDGIVEIYTNLPGIAGINGSLPDCYTENFITFNRESKRAVLDFFDIFNDRMLSLRYTFLKRQNVETLSDPIERSVIGNIIFSLSGFNFNLDRAKSLKATVDQSIPEQFKISAQNLFWRSTRSSSGLKVMLTSFFKVPINIKQFVGEFITSRPGEQTLIGKKGNYNTLGRTTMLGNKIWDSTNGIVVEVGPLDFNEYLKFLPKSSVRDQKFSPLQKMKEIVMCYAPHGINVTLRFILDKCFVKETTLNGVNRLNKDAFIFGMHASQNAFFEERI